MLPGLRLRQVREGLGLTYRDVERVSYELASRRGRPEFILHISRLADIENRHVVPSIHKLYALAAVYHLDPLKIFGWYDVPIDNCFDDAVSFPTPETHRMAPPASMRIPVRFDPAFDPKRTEFLSRMVERWGYLEGTMTKEKERHCYGYVGLSDRRMVPLLRPGSIVLVDTSVRQITDEHWSSEYDRPMYFVEIRNGYRCGWFHKDGSSLVMQPHPLSRCLQETWTTPGEAEVIGKVVGLVMRLNEPWNFRDEEAPVMPGGSSRRDL